VNTTPRIVRRALREMGALQGWQCGEGSARPGPSIAHLHSVWRSGGRVEQWLPALQPCSCCRRALRSIRSCSRSATATNAAWGDQRVVPLTDLGRLYVVRRGDGVYWEACRPQQPSEPRVSRVRVNRVLPVTPLPTAGPLVVRGDKARRWAASTERCPALARRIHLSGCACRRRANAHNTPPPAPTLPPRLTPSRVVRES
jgi:hypothetical protein